MSRPLLARGLLGRLPGREGGAPSQETGRERRRLPTGWGGGRNKEAGSQPQRQGPVRPHPWWEKHSPRKPSSSTMMV